MISLWGKQDLRLNFLTSRLFGLLLRIINCSKCWYRIILKCNNELQDFVRCKPVTVLQLFKFKARLMLSEADECALVRYLDYWRLCLYFAHGKVSYDIYQKTFLHFDILMLFYFRTFWTYTLFRSWFFVDSFVNDPDDQLRSVISENANKRHNIHNSMKDICEVSTSNRQDNCWSTASAK